MKEYRANHPDRSGIPAAYHAIRREVRKPLLYARYFPTIGEGNYDLVWKDDKFNVEEELDRVKGPFVQLSGPPESGVYCWGDMRTMLDLEYLPKPVLTTGNYLEKGVQVLVDNSQLPFRDNSVGVIFASDVTSRNINPIIEESKRVLEPSGLLILKAQLDCSHFYYNHPNPDHVRGNWDRERFYDGFQTRELRKDIEFCQKVP